MLNFCRFFKNLYSKPPLSQERLAELVINKDEPSSSMLEISINRDITIDELGGAINQLKRGKAVSEDLIANDFLRSSGYSMRLTICQPDTPNQLGFCKGAQTSDHILTLTTCIDKYTHHVERGRLYSCFVDYAKAFDTVCREALIYKLWHMGIKGRFFNCLEFMYSNSKAKVKLLTKLSASIKILCDTKQGHPMSPELFKCYINDLSEQLNNMDDVDVPVLNNVRISHLLWADNLVLLSLNAESLQKMLDQLFAFGLEWGLSVNIKNTAVLVFNKSGRLL